VIAEVILTVPVNISSPGCLVTGLDSPVREDSSNVVLPDAIIPSVGGRAPGAITIWSPSSRWSTGTDRVKERPSVLPGLDSPEERDSFFSTFELDGGFWLSVSTSNAVSDLGELKSETASVVLDSAYASVP